MPRIAVSGSIAYDTIMVFPGRFRDHILADRTHLINVSFQVDHVERRRGGTAANVCYTLALLGERPLLCGAVGAEDFEEYAGLLEASGVDTSAALRCDDVGTASGYITTDLDDNQITAFYAGAMARAAAIDLTALTDIADVVVAADAAEAMARHIDDSVRLRARLTFVPAQQIPAMPDDVLRRGMETAWLIAGNDYEIGMIQQRLGISVEELSAHSLIAVTKGAAGSELHTARGVVEIPPAPVERVVDPTGAGDAYVAGLLCALRAGAPPEVAGRVGAVTASFAVERAGPQDHSFTREELLARYSAAFGAAVPPGTLPERAPA